MQMGGVSWWISECKMGLITDLNRFIRLSNIGPSRIVYEAGVDVCN